MVAETTTRNHTTYTIRHPTMAPKSRHLSSSPSISSRRPPDLTLKPNNAGELSALVTSTTRSLSVSFQGEAFSLPISKTKITSQSPSPDEERKPTPTRQIDHVHRWPGTIPQPNLTVLSKTTFTFDCEVDNNNISCSNAIQSMDLDSTRASFNACKSNPDTGGNSLHLLNPHPDGNLVKDWYSDTSGVQQNGLPIGIIVSPKFWQQANSRIRRLQHPSSLLSTTPNTPQKNFNSKRFSSDNCLSSGASPNRMRPSSPRGMISPRRNSACGISNNFSDTPSVLSFAVDVRRGKVGENRFFDAHVLRLLYNRRLQWRFVNARNEDIVLKQKHSVEENLWNAWITMADLRDSVTKKRHRLQLLRQKLKLASILKAQMVFLEDWAYLDNDHSVSLLGAIEALNASTLRLPVGAGATADLQSMKDAISSALDVMHAMGSSMISLCLQVEEVNLMVTEIAKVSAKERAMLRICKDFLSVLSALKVKDCSLRTHTLQRSSAK